MAESSTSLQKRIERNRSARNSAAVYAAGFALSFALSASAGLWIGKSFLNDMTQLQVQPEKISRFNAEFTESCLRRYGPEATPNDAGVKACIYDQSYNKAALAEFGYSGWLKGFLSFALSIGCGVSGVAGIAFGVNAVTRTGYGVFLGNKAGKPPQGPAQP